MSFFSDEFYSNFCFGDLLFFIFRKVIIFNLDLDWWKEFLFKLKCIFYTTSRIANREGSTFRHHGGAPLRAPLKSSKHHGNVISKGSHGAHSWAPIISKSVNLFDFRWQEFKSVFPWAISKHLWYINLFIMYLYNVYLFIVIHLYCVYLSFYLFILLCLFITINLHCVFLFICVHVYYTYSATQWDLKISFLIK